MSDETEDDGVEKPEDAEASAAGGEAAEPEATSVDLPDMSADAEAQSVEQSEAERPDDDEKSATDLESVFDVPVQVSAVLGKTNIDVASLLKLQRGAIVELDRRVGEAIDIFVNNRLVARGEVVLVEDRLGVTMTEIVKGDQT
ncbi:MAG: hypothetical protein Tsb0010_13690 [Parvularculaceae bacterium]